jgi:hypothetical protein
MKHKKIVLALVFILFTNIIYAQSDEYPMSGEGNRDVVKLFWLPQQWPQNLEGFIIKRRVLEKRSKGDWKTLTENFIYPELSLEKDLSNVERDPNQRDLIKEKLRDYLNGNVESVRLSENSKSHLLETFKKNSEAIKALSIYLYKDYDIALMHGFAFIDRNIPKAEKYEYGLFLKFDDNSVEKLVNSFIWEYGTSSIIKFDMDISYKAKRNKKSVSIQWEFDSDLYFGTKEVSGFNIYRKEDGSEYEKLNDDKYVVGRDKDNRSQLKYNDRKIKDSVVYYYAAAPVSIFNSIGEYSEIKFDTRDVPEEFTPPELILGNDESDFESEGISLKWDFKETDERFINGFYIGVPNGKFTEIDTLSNLIKPSAREFNITNLQLPDDNTYRFKIIVDIKDYQDIFSKEFTYYVIPRPPIPNGLKTEVVKESKTETYIKLSWDAKESNDQLTQSYKLYETSVNSNDSLLYYASHIGYITTNEHKFLVDYMGGDKYGFAISAVSNDGYESERTSIVYEQVPNYEIGWIRIETIVIDNNRITLTWNYDEYYDLAGFKLIQNDVEIEDASILGPTSRTWTSGVLQPGKYSFKIQAYTTFGVESEISQKRSKTIQ